MTSYTMRMGFLLMLWGLMSMLCPLVSGCATTGRASKASVDSEGVQRYGMVIGLKPEQIETYKRLHAEPWPEVTAKIKECGIRNYSIHLAAFPGGTYYLFGYFEYVGRDFQADMKKMADDPKTQEWWKLTDPCQIPLENRGEGEWWKNMEEVFYCP